MALELGFLLKAHFRREVSPKLECSIVFILGKVNILFFKLELVVYFICFWDCKNYSLK